MLGSFIFSMFYAMIFSTSEAFGFRDGDSRSLWSRDDSPFVSLDEIIKLENRGTKSSTSNGATLVIITRSHGDPSISSSLKQQQMLEVIAKVTAPTFYTQDQVTALIAGTVAHKLIEVLEPNNHESGVEDMFGVLTPASAFGLSLIKLLRDAGFEFEVLRTNEVFEEL